MQILKKLKAPKLRSTNKLYLVYNFLRSWSWFQRFNPDLKYESPSINDQSEVSHTKTNHSFSENWMILAMCLRYF